MSHRRVHAFCLTVAFILLSVISRVGVGDVLCLRHGIEGYDKQYETATKVLSANTHDFSRSEIYITRGNGGGLYAQSNFVPGSNPYPVKLATSNSRLSLADVFENFAATGLPDGALESSALQDRLISLHQQKVKYVIDQDLLTGGGGIDLDLADASNLHVLIRGESQPRPLVRFGDPRGPPSPERFAIDLGSGLFTEASEKANPAELRKFMSSRKFSSGKFAAINLVADSATQQAIRAGTRPLAFYSPTDLRTLEASIAANSGKTVALVTHVEGDNAVMLGSQGEELLRVPLSDVVRLADSNHVNLIVLGCESAQSVPAGVLNKFNSVYAIQQLHEAANATTLAGFFESLASEKLKIVLPGVDGLHASTKVEFAVLSPQETVATDGSTMVSYASTGRVILYFAAGYGRDKDYVWYAKLLGGIALGWFVFRKVKRWATR